MCAFWIAQPGGLVDDAIKEVEGVSDRATAIVAASLVEDHLTTALQARFHKHDQLHAELFKGTGPLAAFSTKIKMAVLVGLLSEKACKETQQIRKIRNHFAHETRSVTFEAQPICDMVKSLTLPDWYDIRIRVKPADSDTEHEYQFIDEHYKKLLHMPKHRFIATCRLLIAYCTTAPDAIPPAPRL